WEARWATKSPARTSTRWWSRWNRATTTAATPGAAATTEPDPRWAAAVRSFDAGQYFEAHELWEELWNDAEGEERQLYQALVQIAAGYAKLDIGEVNGARKLFERGLARLGASSLTTRLH